MCVGGGVHACVCVASGAAIFIVPRRHIPEPNCEDVSRQVLLQKEDPPEFGQHHPTDWSAGLNKKEERESKHAKQQHATLFPPADSVSISVTHTAGASSVVGHILNLNQNKPCLLLLFFPFFFCRGGIL